MINSTRNDIALKEIFVWMVAAAATAVEESLIKLSKNWNLKRQNFLIIKFLERKIFQKIIIHFIENISLINFYSPHPTCHHATIHHHSNSLFYGNYFSTHKKYKISWFSKYKFECSLVFCGVNTGMSNHHYIEFRHTSDIILAFCNNFVSLTHSLLTISSWLSAKKKYFCCCSFQIFMLNTQFLSYLPHTTTTILLSECFLHVKVKKG